MKKLYALCYGVILLCIVGTAILLIFTPDTIPVHYNFAGEVDRFGSKYENLIWPIFTIIMGAFFILLAKQQRKKGETVQEKFFSIPGYVPCFSLLHSVSILCLKLSDMTPTQPPQSV